MPESLHGESGVEVRREAFGFVGMILLTYMIVSRREGMMLAGIECRVMAVLDLRYIKRKRLELGDGEI